MIIIISVIQASTVPPPMQSTVVAGVGNEAQDRPRVARNHLRLKVETVLAEAVLTCCERLFQK
jgi:hypothetical protein